MNYLASQFSNPRGLVGQIIGRIMAVTNQAKDDWTISLLDLQPSDRILEIGFGSGATIEKISNLVQEGFIAGIDRSETMVQQASHRNAAAICQGLVEIKHGSVERIPYRDKTFDKAISSNCHFFWIDPIESFQEIWRVLKPSGLVAISWQPRWAKNEAMVTESAEKTREQLSLAGFNRVKLEFKPMNPVSCICACGVK